MDDIMKFKENNKIKEININIFTTEKKLPDAILEKRN